MATIDSAIIAYYSANSTPNDSKGTLHGTVNNTNYSASGIAGYCIDSVSGSQQLTTASLTIPAENSVSLWVRPGTTSSRRIAGIGNIVISCGGASGYYWAVVSVGATPNIIVNPGTPYTAGTTWINIVVTTTGLAGGAKVYVNGTHYGTGGSAISSFTGTSLVGGIQLGSMADALVDEIIIFNRIMTASEVSWIYNGGTPRVYPIAEIPAVITNPSFFLNLL